MLSTAILRSKSFLQSVETAGNLLGSWIYERSLRLSSRMKFPLWFLLRHLAVETELEPVDTSCRRQLCGGRYLSGIVALGCWVLRIVLSRACSWGTAWAVAGRAQVRGSGWRVRRGRQEASRCLPSLALGLKEINDVLWFWTRGQKSAAPTVQCIWCCIEGGNCNCQCCNFFFLDVYFLCKRLLEKNKPQTYPASSCWWCQEGFGSVDLAAGPGGVSQCGIAQGSSAISNVGS